MKKTLAPMLGLLAVLVVAAGAVQAVEPGQACVVTTLDSQGQVVVFSFDDVLIQYGDPDSGIGGNRGDVSGTTGSTYGSNCEGSAEALEDFLDQLLAWLQQWRPDAR